MKKEIVTSTVCAESISSIPPGHWTPDLLDSIRAASTRVGFDLTGLVSASPGPRSSHFAAWVDSGRAGEMDYLKRRDEQGTLLRSSVQTALPWAQSVLVCAFNYNAAGPHSIDAAPNDTGWIARYAWNGRQPQHDDSVSNQGKPLPADYHDDLLARLRSLESDLLAEAPCQTRCYVDTGPILERDLAARAGIGWIGKNTCVLNQQFGSWLLLGVIVTSLALPPDSAALILPAQDRCGSCTRCIDACPTEALVAPRQMDASRCIAYLTIEKKGNIPEALRESIGRQVFGCDICQEVCPWNRKAPIAEKKGLLTREELINPSLDWLASLDAAEFRRLFRGSPLERTRRRRFLRNVAIAMGNTGDPRFVPRLEQWAANLQEDPVLAESATWALQKIRSGTSRLESRKDNLS